ncbi:DUF2812 domain-containing protein [Desulfitobacterium sp.]|uniref:DUF2812 domain-containing protein n=1 Tax=Desulfitobacterium sp. TaxID=49981 RepID=UPI002B78895D|nr:DUF2812 domain-containing protein [Desulfitobacterium sp.]HVJ48351.1 DUF2812 domain-containing protein [Desulfitobacterium sp.]
MIKKVIRPFWSLDVMKTETWLSEMASSGYRLNKVNFMTREFIFEDDKQRTVQYRIVRQKVDLSAASQSLINSQWYSVFTKGKWSILANENEAPDLKIFPSRESILKRNLIIKYSIGILLALMSFAQIQSIFLFTAILSPDSYSFLSPWFIISRLLVASSLLYIILRVNQSDTKLRMVNSSDLTLPKSTILDGKTERALRNEGKLLKKVKLAWMYAPDKLEEWLEDMEMKGYNLVRVSWSGNTFYFTKGEPRSIKYCTDYQELVNDSYFEIHKSDGWNMIFTSKQALTIKKYTLWRKEYTDEEPELYSDNNHILNHARNQCVLYCILYVPIIVLYISILELNLRILSLGKAPSWPMIIMLSVLVIGLGYFTLQSLGFYLRTRKKINN